MKSAPKHSVPKACQLPPIHTCRFCQEAVQYLENAAIYGKNYGKWPWAYICTGCKAFVGTHPNSNIPLGTLADKATREARKSAHSAFDHIWRDGHMPSRGHAYEWLADKLGIPRAECHMAWFEVERCAAVVHHSRLFLQEKCGVTPT